MKSHHQTARIAVLVFTLLGLAFGSLVPAAQAESKAKGPSADPDGGWPRSYDASSGAKIVLYQPQVSSWEGQKRMVAYSAVSYLPKDAKEPTMGTVKVQADTNVALEERLVSFAVLEVTEANFPTLQKWQTQEIVSTITGAIPKEERVIALDRVLAAVDKSQVVPKNVENVKCDPPRICTSTRPALLVVTDGAPVWGTINGNSLRFVVNTNWDLFQEGTSDSYFLRYDKVWLKATDLKGKWTPATTLPPSFSSLPDADWQDVKGTLTGKKIAASKVPAVILSEEPAELILLDGNPDYEPVAGTGLLWVSNTESDVFRMGKDGAFYYLVAGRWFSAPALEGPWTFATPSLPDDFKKIPAEHKRSRVLASVPGTPQAAEAVLLAQIPQTARVNKKEVKAPEVSYQEAPKFEPIGETKVERAVNTDKNVLKVGETYYLCYDGVWFSAPAPEGPWTATASVPGEIYTIPVSSPAYAVTYVTVVEDNPDDDWIEYSCTAGYWGLMTAWGCCVWGSGWYYPPYIWGGCYWGYPVTYGCGAAYNPWTGRFGWGAGYYGPFGGAGAGAVYNPRTGGYVRGAGAYGPNGAVGVARGYNPRTDTAFSTRQAAGPYGSWGSTTVQRGDSWATTRRYTDNSGNTTRVTRGEQGSMVSRRGDNGFVAAGSGGNIYAGHDGNVYQRQDGGGWEQVQRPEPKGGVDRGSFDRTGLSQNYQPDRATMDQLNRDSQARAMGAQRTGDFGNVRSGGGLGSASTYRPAPTSVSRGSYGGGYNRVGYGGGFSGGGFGGGRGGFGGGGFRGGGRR